MQLPLSAEEVFSGVASMNWAEIKLDLPYMSKQIAKMSGV